MLKINVKSKVDERGWNKHQFAKIAQIGYPAACALYDGTTDRVFFDTIEKVCIALECTPNDIITTDDPQLQRLLAYQSKLSELENKE